MFLCIFRICSGQWEEFGALEYASSVYKYTRNAMNVTITFLCSRSPASRCSIHTVQNIKIYHYLPNTRVCKAIIGTSMAEEAVQAHVVVQGICSPAQRRINLLSSGWANDANPISSKPIRSTL